MINVEGLEHRDFVDGSADCFALVRDLYDLNWQIKIRNYARPTNGSSELEAIILAAYEREGFEQIANWKISDLRPGDVMCMCVDESTPNHFGVYLGNNEFIHHLRGNLSSRSPLKGHWLHYTAYLLRHPDVPDLRNEGKKDTTIEELLNARHPR